MALIVVLWLPLAAQHQQASPRAKVVSPHGTLNMACENCHTYTGWKPLRAIPEFNHDRTKYPLRGMHVNVSCTQCHTNLVFSKVGTKCADCHADFHRGQFGANCESCHTVKGWKVNIQQIKNHDNRFPLLGAHALAQCEDCHTNAAAGQFVGLSTDCNSCHAKTFQAAQFHRTVNLKAPTGDCQQCHTSMDSWAGAKFDHLKFTGFALTGAHAKLDCSVCHLNGNFTATPASCYSCHQKDYNQATNPNHVQGNFPQNCLLCHNTSTWAGATFDHSKFPLTGGHANVKCESCHKNGQYTAIPTACNTCHMPDFQKTTNPNHTQAKFPTDCTTCHTIANWTTVTFDHTRFTSFPLTGAHTSAKCQDCHTGNNFSTTPATCVGCHKPDYDKTTNPNHAKNGIATTCEVCHNTSAWQPATFDHSKTTFPLTGAHTSVSCEKCHTNSNFGGGLPTDCNGCHNADYMKTTSPNHAQSGIPTTCAVCHNTAAWQPATFDHSKTTFPLTGAHTSVSCEKCHTNNNFGGGLPTDCNGCHNADYLKTTNPNHAQSGIPTTCIVCHNTAAWQPATFDHSKTTFPLTGAHTSVACEKCHTNNNYNGSLPTDCNGCHNADFVKTTDPNHVTAGFPTQCVLCHTTTAWSPSSFDHSKTAFPLTGAHTTVLCATCHKNNNYTSLPTDCAGCHLTDMQAVKDPNHVSAGWPTTCATCHTTTAWSPANFDHTAFTKFPLTGKHTTVPCASCHVGGKYMGTPTDCASCHMTDYNGTTNPNHKAAGFPTDCSICHSTSGWPGAVFDHNKTKFPLTGAHVGLDCTKCHANGVYAGLPTNCSSCHTADFNGAKSPDHVASGFPMTCEVCHNTTAWSPSSFDHSKTTFPLTGTHLTTKCDDCHKGSYSGGLPTDCYSCHKTEYTGTTNPNHAAAAFPTTCGTCHTTTSWLGAVFNHTWFPIYSGTHAGKWTSCADCHTNAADYTVFSCITCHTHSQANTDPNHRGVRGYTYGPTTCYSCHPTGNGG